MPAAGVSLDERPVLPLIEEEAGLLAGLPVNQELMAVLQNGARAERWRFFGLKQISVTQVKSGFERGGP